MNPMLAEDLVVAVHFGWSKPLVALLKATGQQFYEPRFLDEVVDTLRENPELVTAWVRLAADQRWSPSAYIDDMEVGWFDGERRFTTHHDDPAVATADFIRRLALWLGEHEVFQAPSSGHNPPGGSAA